MGVLGLLMVSFLIQSSLQMCLENPFTPISKISRFVLRTALGPWIFNIKKAQSHNKTQPQIDNSVPFPCQLNNTRSRRRPKSVHKLRPGDIDVIGAIGDSMTAGFGLLATNIFSVGFESRGLSFSGGGDKTWRTYLTLPNILKVFNSKLYGYATGNSNTYQKQSHFNVAEGGAVSADTPHMAKVLVERMKRDSKIRVKRDWKMITYFIGGNDFCREMCTKSHPESIVDKHRHDLIKTLRILRDKLPRTFVNVIPVPGIEIITNFSNQPRQCHEIHNTECPCIFGVAFKKSQPRFRKIMRKWQEVEQEVVDMDEFNNKEDFAVVFQPFTLNYEVPDLTYMSADCFHISQKGGALAANSLWTNLLEPVGKKATKQTDFFISEFKCTTAKSPFLFTRTNSKR